MHYKDAFEFASKHLLHKNTMIMNSDCYVDRGFEQLNETILINKTMYFLTRHETPEKVRLCHTTDFCGEKSKYIGSHDAFLFRFLVPLPSQLLDKIDYRPNLQGIEQVLMFYFTKYGGFKIKNPCRILHIVHHHCATEKDKKASSEYFINGRRVDRYLKIRSVFTPFSGL